jgi:hypothetical protein
VSDGTYVPRPELWNMYNDHIVQGRHHETQRATVLGLLLTLATALVGLATWDHHLGGRVDAMVGSLIAALGVFGAGFTFKHYERYCYHMARARGFREALDATLPDRSIQEILDGADRVHNRAFPRLRKLRLHYWWIALNLFVVAVGSAVTVVASCFPS